MKKYSPISQVVICVMLHWKEVMPVLSVLIDTPVSEIHNEMILSETLYSLYSKQWYQVKKNHDFYYQAHDNSCKNLILLTIQYLKKCGLLPQL